MGSRVFALIVWAAVAISLAFWGLRWMAQPASVPLNASSVSLDGDAYGDIRRLLAGPPAAASGVQPALTSAASALAGRLKLLGVVASLHNNDQGVALLAIDGKPPRAVRIGGVVDGDMLLLSLNQRGAQIGPSQGPSLVTLDLPPLTPPATSTLPPPTGVNIGSPARPSAGPSVGPSGGPSVGPSGAPPTGATGPTGPTGPMYEQPAGRMPPPAPGGASNASGSLGTPEGT